MFENLQTAASIKILIFLTCNKTYSTPYDQLNVKRVARGKRGKRYGFARDWWKPV